MRRILNAYMMVILSIALPACMDIFEDESSGGQYDDDTVSCDPGGNGEWTAEWAAKECRVFELVNQRRAQGADCGAEGHFEPASPLDYQNNLSEAARLHSLDMGERDYFSHDSLSGPNGDDMRDRIENAGYLGWMALGENIAAGLASAEDTVDGWMKSPGHCANILNPGFTQLGVGYAEVVGSEMTHYWTQDFGRR